MKLFLLFNVLYVLEVLFIDRLWGELERTHLGTDLTWVMFGRVRRSILEEEVGSRDCLWAVRAGTHGVLWVIGR